MPDAAPSAYASSLLAPDEPPPVVVERAEGGSPLVLVADHAGRRFPRATGTLGLAPGELERHIAYDIGIAPVAREVARALDAPLVAQTYSRLVIDCNRPTHVPSSIPEVSETTEVPGNRDLPADGARGADRGAVPALPRRHRRDPRCPRAPRPADRPDRDAQLHPGLHGGEPALAARPAVQPRRAPRPSRARPPGA